MKKFLIYIGVLSLIVLSPIILNSEYVQKSIYPEKYWNNRIVHLEGLAESYKKDMVWCALEIDNFQKTSMNRIRQLLVEGYTHEQARETINVEKDVLVETCRIFREALSDTQINIENAKLELQKLTK